MAFKISSDPTATKAGKHGLRHLPCVLPQVKSPSLRRKCVIVLTCHGVFPGCVFTFSAVVGGIAASGLIVRFPFFEADHFPRWSWGTCCIKKWKRVIFGVRSIACSPFHTVNVCHKNTWHNIHQHVCIFLCFVGIFFVLLLWSLSLTLWQLVLYSYGDTLTWRQAIKDYILRPSSLEKNPGREHNLPKVYMAVLRVRMVLFSFFCFPFF
jgi:hypothetical protein